jgi:hypothetical protein
MSTSEVSFKYDPFGRRIYKSSSSGTSIYAYDSDNLVEALKRQTLLGQRSPDTRKG